VILIKSRHGYPPTLLHGLCLSRAPGNLLDTFQARSHIRTHTQTQTNKYYKKRNTNKTRQKVGGKRRRADPADGKRGEFNRSSGGKAKTKSLGKLFRVVCVTVVGLRVFRIF
jgi:hypothetical protein